MTPGAKRSLYAERSDSEWIDIVPDNVSTATAPDVDARFLRDRQRLKEADFVLQFVDKSASARSEFVRIWREVLDNYLVTPYSEREAVPFIGSTNIATASALQKKGRRSGRSVLKDPETNQIIDTLSAQGIGLLMPTMDYIQAMPIGFDDEQKARFLGRLLQGLLQSPGVYRTNFTIFKDAFIFGTAIVQIGWETRSRLQVTEKPVFNEKTGFLIGAEPDIGEVVYRDGPLFQQKDLFDFYPDPSGTRIQENMLGVAHKFRMSKQEAKRLGAAGVYDKAQVAQAVASAGGKEDHDRAHEEKRFQDLATETHDDYGMMTGFEFWGEVPFQPSDGARNRVITILNGVHVRSHINPFRDGNIPFKEIVLNPIQGRFYGLGIGEIIRFLQDSADNMLMLHTDMADLSARNVLLVGQGFQGDIGRLKRRIPGDVIPVGNIEAVKPVPQEVNALQLSAQEYTRRKLSMREASGATNPLQGFDSPGGDRQTATEVSELVRLASQKVELMVQLVERDDYPWIGKTLHSRIRQFLSREREEILAGERFPVTLDDVDFDSDIRFIGARQAQSKFQKAATLKEALNVLSTNPTSIPILQDVIVRYFRDGLDIQDAESIVKQMVARVQQAQERAAQLQQEQETLKGRTVRNSNESFSTTGAEVQQQGVALA